MGRAGLLRAAVVPDRGGESFVVRADGTMASSRMGVTMRRTLATKMNTSGSDWEDGKRNNTCRRTTRFCVIPEEPEPPSYTNVLLLYFKYSSVRTCHL